MNLTWYLSRLKKMSAAEVFKRVHEQVYLKYSRIKFSNPAICHYNRFAKGSFDLEFQALPGGIIAHDWKNYRIYDLEFDLTQSPDWFFTDKDGGERWPRRHFARINYRAGNPYGDIRFNWELNRLQFLPAMSVSDAPLALRLLSDWVEKNPFLHGPGYLSSMEVALRWISIYRAACLLKHSLNPGLRQTLTGLAITSGSYIENRLSTHSSAGNHLIVEAVGLFWLAKALNKWESSKRWIRKARAILRQQVIRQINSDGSNQEQSFWYLGFVIDALLHYLLLENRNKISDGVWFRIEKALDFIHDLTLPNGSFPDFGDRDDGVVFRCSDGYGDFHFNGLLDIGAYFFNRPDWIQNRKVAKERVRYWLRDPDDGLAKFSIKASQKSSNLPQLKTYPEGGMTLMNWGKGRLLFRHAPLGLETTYGHGHADALSVIFYWNSIPVLIDLGSGQYNGDQKVRDYFRSTIAHNTIEMGGQNQAKILGPFLWDKSYETLLKNYSESPILTVEASHNGYFENQGHMHDRSIKWLEPHYFSICDSFSGESGVSFKGAFHLGSCETVSLNENFVEADFRQFKFSIQFPTDFSTEVYYGSFDPFLGWRSTVYGKWKPTHTVIYSAKTKKAHKHQIALNIFEKSK